MKGKFENFSPEVPSFLWDAVEEKLETRRSKRIGVVWSSVATVVLIAVSGALFFNSPDTVPMKNQEPTSFTENSSSQGNSELPVNSNTQNKSLTDENSSKLNEGSVSTTNAVGTFSKAQSTNNTEARFGNSRINQRTERQNANDGSIRLNTLRNVNRRLTSSEEGSSMASTEVGISLKTDVSLTTNYPVNQGYSEFLNAPYSGAPLKEMIVGDFLQLTLSIPHPQKPLKRKLSRWAFEVGYDMNQTAMSYSVNPQLGQYVHKNYLQRVKEGEVSLVAPQVHTSLRYQINENWVVTAGFGFTQNRTSQSFDFRDSVPVSVAQGFEPDAYGNYPIFGYAGLGQNVKYDGVQTFNMLSIPIGVVYEYPISRRLKFTTEANLRYNYVSGTSGASLNYYDLSLQNSSKDLYRNSVFSAKLGAGIQKDLDKKRSIGVRVNTQGAITPMNLENSAVSNRGWSVGLSGYYFWRIF